LRDALIDLGEVPSGEPETSIASPRQPLPYRWILGPLTAVLVALLGGGGPPPSPPPAPVILSIAPGDQVQADGDRLYVIGTPEPFGTVVRTYPIQAYDLPEVTPVASYRVTVAGDVYTVLGIGDDVLLVGHNDNQSAVPGLMAVRPGDGEPLWKRPASLYGLSEDRRQVLIHEGTAPGRADSRDVWHALDPVTGTTRWSAEQPVGGWTAMPAVSVWPNWPARFYTVHTDGLTEMHDGVTGAVIRSVRLPRPPGDDFRVWAGGGLLIAGYGEDETVGYDEQTLTERWRRDGGVLPLGGYQQACTPMICLSGFASGVTVIDPATGAEVWRGEGYDSAEVSGDRVLVVRASQTDPSLAVIEPRTGRVITVAGQWLSGGPGPEPGTVWVYRHQTIGYALRYGTLRLSDGRVQVLGQAERIAGDCQFTAEALVCRRLDSSIAIWRL
jgi:hypothetical protein